jgi:hypothetical protein
MGDLTNSAVERKGVYGIFFRVALPALFGVGVSSGSLIKRVIKHLRAENLRTKMKIKNQKVS